MPSATTVTLNSSAKWQLDSVPWTVSPVLIFLGGGGLVGEGMKPTFDEHGTPVGEMMTTHPEHPANGSSREPWRDAS